MKNKVTIFIDESGTLPDPKDRVVIIAAVGTDLPSEMLDINRTIRKKIRSRKRSEDINEIKFYQAGDRTKQEFLNELVKRQVDIFALIVEKGDQKIADEPKNFAWLCYLLLVECLIFYRGKIVKIVFDRHFHKKKDQDEFDKILSALLKENYELEHVDSINNPAVNTADMVAGSLLWKYTGKTSEFYELIKTQVIVENIINWKQARRKFYETKNST